MEKKEYITNQLKKTFGKKYENYCITRIIFLVNRTDVRFVTQQLFKRKGKNIALADLYFPQINLWVEVDEEHHIENIESDYIRTSEVIEMSRISEEVLKKYKALEEVITSDVEKPYRIIIYNKTIEEINKQIDDIVKEINQRINNFGLNFIPWIVVNNPPEYYLNKGLIRILDNAKFRIIDSIGKLFNMVVPPNDKRHGFFNVKNNIYCWCPTLKLFGDECEANAWENEISEDGKTIYETQKNMDANYFNSVINEKQTRYVFTKYKDETGEKIYKFKGVFELDKEKTLKLNKRTWIKINDEINLSIYSKH